jgi:hypothetical protein
VGNRNIFVAECKFWKGPAKLRETIDQLLGYTCWRDTKTALIVFNRGGSLSTTLARIPETVAAHPNYLRTLNNTSEIGLRFVLHHRDDPERELTMTVLVFEVPA